MPDNAAEAALAAINAALARAGIKTQGVAGVTDLVLAFDGQCDLTAQAEAAVEDWKDSFQAAEEAAQRAEAERAAAVQRAEEAAAVLRQARTVRDVHRLRHPQPLPDCIACSIGAALGPTVLVSSGHNPSGKQRTTN